MGLTNDQVREGILRFCQPRPDEVREQEIQAVKDALTGCPEWKAFLDPFIISLVKRRPVEQTWTLIVTCFALGVEVGRTKEDR